MEKNVKHASWNTRIKHLLCGLLGGRLMDCVLTRHFVRQCFLLPAEVSLSKRVTFCING